MPQEGDKDKGFAERLKRAIDTSADLAATARDAANEVYDSSGLREVVDQASELLGEHGQRLDEKTGLLTKARTAVDGASDTLDRVTGKAILEVVVSLAEQQGRYNDLLATKLDEALTRIAALEATLGSSSKK